MRTKNAFSEFQLNGTCIQNSWLPFLADWKMTLWRFVCCCFFFKFSYSSSTLSIKTDSLDSPGFKWSNYLTDLEGHWRVYCHPTVRLLAMDRKYHWFSLIHLLLPKVGATGMHKCSHNQKPHLITVLKKSSATIDCHCLMPRAVGLTHTAVSFLHLKNNPYHSTQCATEPLITNSIPHNEELEMGIFGFMKKRFFIYTVTKDERRK